MTYDRQDTEVEVEYHWRETYFILFKSADRPTLTQVEQVLGGLSDRLVLEELTANDEGQFESVRVVSPDDYAAIEINYEAGEAVVEQGSDLAKQLRDDAHPDQLSRLLASDARLDVMHFEQVVTLEPNLDDEMDEMIDPTSLLMVVDALVELIGGVAIDPASGEILS